MTTTCKPWQVKTFKVSNDPHFEEKLIDVVGLYLNPPQRAVVFSFDEKTQVQALDRTQPSLPMKPGRAGTMTHDYKRHGTTDLFAALNIATGEVITDNRKRHTASRRPGLLQEDRPRVPQATRRPCRLGQPLGPHGAAESTEWLAEPRAGPLAPALLARVNPFELMHHTD